VRILAAIVTHNRSALLERCIDHVQAQTRPPDGLMVINNGSTDGTEAMLGRRGIPFVTQANVGGAGGFNRAIQCALDEDYDSVWLMDDDGFPDRSALEILSGASVAGVACAPAPRRSCFARTSAIGSSSRFRCSGRRAIR
jgi:rhamnopyranosyl-N-acetylglucosaminyl-diphospho-decaprenol beta-1,3/1,4-galactofuranosyltransferase